MPYKIEFQYKPPGTARPNDYVQEENLVFENNAYLPIPEVGDTVFVTLTDRRKGFKVLTRHFSYVKTSQPDSCWCIVNIVVTDVDSDEMAARLKE